MKSCLVTVGLLALCVLLHPECHTSTICARNQHGNECYCRAGEFA